MFNVEVQRDHPYVESLWYDFDDEQEAREFAIGEVQRLGVDQALLWKDGELLDTYRGGVL